MEILAACADASAATWPAVFAALFGVFLTLDFGAAALALARGAAQVPVKDQ